jgi:hypothetical protein
VTTAFAIFDRLLKERMLTEALRFLFDSNESHAQGDAFARGLARQLRFQLPPGRLDITATSEWGTDARRRIDLVLVVRTSWTKRPELVIGLEAKTSSKESIMQIGDYQAALANAFPSIKTRRMVFLTANGQLPISGDHQLDAICPTVTLTWEAVAEIAESLSGTLPLAGEVGSYLRNRFGVHSVVASSGVQFVDNKVIPCVRKLLKLQKPDLRMEWYYPSAHPNEFNLNFKRLNATRLTNVRFFYMLFSPRGELTPGRQVHVLLMAHSQAGRFRLSDAKLLAPLVSRFPPREGQFFQWGPWRCLWSGGCRTLRGFDEDARPISQMIARSYSMTAPIMAKWLNTQFTR